MRVKQNPATPKVLKPRMNTNKHEIETADYTDYAEEITRIVNNQ
jgi:hypothetical protein